MRSGVVLVWIVPVCAAVATWVPLTNSRTAAPSYVRATCVHVLTPSAVGPPMKRTVPLNVAPPAGRSGPASLLALRKYASTSRCMVVRQPLCVGGGKPHAESVMGVVTLSEAEPLTTTRLLTPLKLRAFP